MQEMAAAGEGHGDAVGIAGGDAIGVFFGSAGFDDVADAEGGGGLDVVGEGKRGQSYELMFSILWKPLQTSWRSLRKKYSESRIEIPQPQKHGICG